MTDAEWAVLSSHFPEPSVVGRPRKHGFRAILNAIHYVLRGGSGTEIVTANDFKLTLEYLNTFSTSSTSDASTIRFKVKRRGEHWNNVDRQCSGSDA